METRETISPKTPGKVKPHGLAGRKNTPHTLRMMRCGFRLLDKTAPSLGGRWAYWLWFRTQRFPEPRREQRYRETAERLDFVHDGQALAVYAWGQGPTVLLAHGWNARATQLWGFVDPLVEAGFRVIAFDMPAHGLSAGKHTDLYKMSAALQAVAREFGPVHGAIAHSAGSPALVMALGEGLHIQRVVCLSPPAHTTWMVTSYARALSLSPRMQKTLCRLFERDYGEQVWRQTSAGENVARLDTPALVIHDKDDREVPWQHGEAIAGLWPGARLLCTEQLGHRRILRNAGVIAEAVTFIANKGEDG